MNQDDARWDQEWDSFGLNELEEDVREALLHVQGVVEISRLRLQKIREGQGITIDVHISGKILNTFYLLNMPAYL